MLNQALIVNTLLSNEALKSITLKNLQDQYWELKAKINALRAEYSRELTKANRKSWGMFEGIEEVQAKYPPMIKGLCNQAEQIKTAAKEIDSKFRF